MVKKIMAKQMLLFKFLAVDDYRCGRKLLAQTEKTSVLALQLLKEGFSQTEVAEVLRINRRTLSDYARKWQLEGEIERTVQNVEKSSNLEPRESIVPLNAEASKLITTT